MDPTTPPQLTVPSLTSYVLAHWYSIGTTLALIVQWIGSFIANGLDMPTTTDTRWYRFVFRSALYLAGNKARADRAADPQPGDTVATEKKKVTVEKIVTQTVVPPDNLNDK